MSLRHAILTALLERPSSGLELAGRFDRSIGYFWPASHQQIYRELARLEGDDLIAQLPQRPGRGSPKVYAVEDAGRQELADWVSGSDDPRPHRDALLVRMRAAAVIGSGPLDAELTRHLALRRRQLEEYLAIEARDFAVVEDEPARLQHAILKAGIGLEEFWIDWISRTLDELAAD